MSGARAVYIGTDSGATTTKVGGVWDDGTTISTRVLQHPTDAQLGPQAVVRGWVDSVDEYLREHELIWDQVHGVGLAIPGPFQKYGVLDHTANLPPSFTGFDVHTPFMSALSERAAVPCR